MSLTNPNKVVTEERLLDFYQSIFPYLGGMPEALVNKFSKGDLLSTTEKIVGCHTNGKPIYQKTFTGNTSASGNASFAVNTNNIVTDVGASVEAYIDIKGGVMCAGNNARFIPFGTAYLTINDSSNGNIWAMASALNNSNASLPNKIQIYTGNNSNILSKPYILTVQYTKTTDAANSFKFGDENDYSTAEKIIGTWIDGKPIYQKTVDCGTLQTTQSQSTKNWEVSHGVSNIDTVVGQKTILIWGSLGSSVTNNIIGSTNPDYHVNIYCKKTGIYFEANQYYEPNITKIYSTIQYTKTS